MGCFPSRAARKTKVYPAQPLPDAPSEAEDLLAPGWVACDMRGVVQKQSQEIRQLLGRSVVGRDLRFLMTGALAALHLEHILPAYRRAPDSADWPRILGEHARRRCRLTDEEGCLVEVEVTLEMGGPDFLVHIFPVSHPATFDFNRRRLLAHRLGIKSANLPRTDSIPILVVDIVNSTEVLRNGNHLASYFHHATLQNAVKELLMRRYDPLVTLYETVGDSMLFVAHAGDTPGLVPRPLCSTLVDFAQDLLQEAARVWVPLRASAAFGELLCAVMDGQVRIFGVPITKACRLQAQVAPAQGTGVYNGIMVCEAFYQKLLSEKQQAQKEAPPADELSFPLKGLGERVRCRCINLDISVDQEVASSRAASKRSSTVR